jgi:hypothetical protein
MDCSFSRSNSVKSSSFFMKKSTGSSNMRLLMVVSMWKTLTFLSMTRPMRSVQRCSFERDGSMYDSVSRIV